MIVDSVSTIGDLNPVLTNTGGFASEPAVTIANDVLMEILSERFPWKWNRMKYPPFALNNRQQDYGSLTVRNLGWLENGYRVDMNSTQVPPPVWPIVVVRDLPVSRVGAGWPAQACWYPNDQLEWWMWPGPGVIYVNPIGSAANPDNPATNIELADGSLCILTTYGTTGATPPALPAAPVPAPDNWPVGAVIDDGTCQWTVADPSAQGIRMYPPPAGNAGGNVWLIRLFAQKKAPVITDLTSFLEPIPDDQIKWFRDGFIAYCHRHSSVPAIKARYPTMKNEWLASMAAATKQADREDESKGFYPDKGMLSPEYYTDPGPGNPYWRQWGGS
jgi:hypothetical protein